MTAITFNLKPAIKLQATQSGLAVGPAGADGDDGAEVELQKSATHIQWRHVGDVSWTNLVALADITGDSGVDGSDGAAGADGTEIELQKSATHIQWRYVGGSTWTDLVALADITGPAGTVTAENIATAAHGASADTLTDDSEISFLKEVTSVWTLLKITWANVKSNLKSYFDDIYATPEDIPGDVNELNDEDHLLDYEKLIFICSRFETDLASDTGVAYLKIPHDKNYVFTKLPEATVKVAGEGLAIQVDINDDGSSIFSTVLSIDSTEKTSHDSASPGELSAATITFAAGSEITVDIDQTGSSTKGQELIVIIDGYWTNV